MNTSEKQKYFIKSGAGWFFQWDMSSPGYHPVMAGSKELAHEFTRGEDALEAARRIRGAGLDATVIIESETVLEE